MKYHISLDGKARPCRSQGPCPLGASFEGRQTAVKYSEVSSAEIGKYLEAKQSKTKYTMDEAKERGAYVNQTVNALLKNNMDTFSLYYDEEKGEFTEERQKQHRKILDDLHEKFKDVPTDGKVLFSAGLPGAGKTTIIDMLGEQNPDMKKENYAIVSSDDFKEKLADEGMIPHIEGFEPMEVSTLVHTESSYLADKFLKELAEKNKNIIYDFTCKDFNSTSERMEILKDAGYTENKMQFVFVDIPLETAEHRALIRYNIGLNKGITEGTTGGRYLPKEVLYKNASKTGKYSSVNAEALLQVYNHNKENGLPQPIIYDNSGDSFADPTYKPTKLNFEEFSNR